MADDILKNIWNELSSKGKTDSDFDAWQTNLNENEDVQANVYNYLKDNDYTKSEFSEWKSNALVAKTNDSASADPSVESGKKDTGSESESGLSAWQSIKNSFSNMGEQIGDVYEFWFTDEGANASLDIATNAVYSGLFGQEGVDKFVDGKPQWLVEGIGSKDMLEEGGSLDKYKEEKLQSKETLGIIESVKNGDVGGALAGGINAITSMIGSVGFGAGTLGTGFFMDYVAENYVNFNKLKAENLGVTFDELVLSDQADEAIPIGMGAISTALEFIGLGAVAKGAKGALKGSGGNSLMGMGSKYLAEKLIYNKGARSAMNMFATGATEFTTEILQHAADEVNNNLGSVAGTDNESQIMKTIVDAITSQEGLEAGIQGFIGGGGMTASTYSVKAMNSIRTTVDGDAVNKNINKLASLRTKYNTTNDKLVKEGIQKEIDLTESNIADSVRKGNDIYNSLSKEQLSEVESLTDLADAAAYKITELNKKFRRGEITEEQYNAGATGFKAEYDASRKSLVNMELDKNIEFAKTEAESRGLIFKVYESTKAIQGAVNKLKNVSAKDRKTFKDSKGNIHGFSIGNQILINKEVAREQGAINVGAHEVLHPVFNKLIGDSKQQGKIVKQFRRAMTSSQRAFVDKSMRTRGYTTANQYNTEYINVFADALRKKQINYDKTTFEKISGAITGVFKSKGYDNISFESGKDVYNFVKEYDISAEQGSLTEAASKALGNIDLSDSSSVDMNLSKTLTPEQSTETSADIASIKQLAEENAALAKKYNKEPIKSPKQTRLEQKVLSSIKEIIDKVVTNRTKALYDPIADDAKRNVTRDSFKESMRSDIEAMTLNEYNGSQELEKFIVNRSYLRANDLAKRLGIESQEDGGIKKDVDAAKDIVSTVDTQSVDRSGTVERGQATFDQLDMVDDKLISEIESELDKELKTRAAKGTLSEMISVKKGRDTYIISWLENYIDKTLFKKILKKWGAIGESKGKVVIPAGYIDFLNSKKAFDIVTKALPIKTIKKSYGNLFKIERLGRELTAEGNPIYKIPPTDKKTFLTYFLDGKKNTILERQKQLAREIITPITKEIVADYVTEENLATLMERQSIAPETAIDVINKIVIEAQLNDLESKVDRYKGETKGFDVIQFSYNKKDLNSLYAASKTEIDGPAFLKFPKKIRNFIYKLVDDGKLTGNSFGGLVYESFLVSVLKSVSRKIPGLRVVSQRGAGYDSTQPDIVLEFTKDGKKAKVLIEAKKDVNVRFGQVSLGLENGIVILRKNGKVLDPSTMPGGLNLVARAQQGKVYLQEILDIINKEEGTKITKFPMGTSISKETYDKAVQSKAYKDFISLTEQLDKSRVADHYNKKGVYYIQIGKKGLYYMGKDINNLGVPELEASFKGSLRFKRGTTKNNKVFMGIISEPKVIASTLKKSPYTLAEAESVTEIYENMSLSKDLDNEFNDIVEGATGVESKKRYSDAKGKVRGRNKGRFKFFIPPSADDFAGLLSRLLGTGTNGDANAAWFKEKLFNPFAKGIRDFESYKQQTTAMVKALKKRVKNIPKGLSKIGDTGFTNEAAVRVYLWAKAGVEIPGLSKTDQKELIDLVNNSPGLLGFAKELEQAFNGYPEPDNGWLAGTVTTDIINMVNTAKRAEFLQEWQDNVDVIFSKENLNKLRAVYGDNYVEAMEDMLYRMKSGRNRPSGANKLTNKFMNWINDSVGTIMFFNTRSALLQTLSIANFINWGDNNPAKAAAAFANQKQFWSDFAMLFNSDFLKQRRSGLKNDVNADDIASAAESATNKSKAVLSSILKMGFLPTQMADSFAIAMGGASFIRNRINKYKSEGLDTKAAEQQAFLDFQEVAEETQQSSRPDRISQQQASPLGRIILAFANTPMQYMRLTKKAFLDLKNNRGDPKSNISKIVYYTFIQNVIFSSLQSALFASLALGDDEEEMDKKELRIANSMMDTILRGLGIYGAIVSTGKNIVMEIDKQSKADRPDFTKAADKVLDLSPPLSSKIRKLQSAGRAFSYSKIRDRMVGYGLDNPAFYAGGQVVSALTNVPLDRAIKKADNLRVAMDNDTKLWQSIALMLGYSQWDLGLIETGPKKKGFGEVKEWKKKWKKSNWEK